MAPPTGAVAAHYPGRQVIMTPEGCIPLTPPSARSWLSSVKLKSSFVLNFPLNLESGTFVIPALMSFDPLRLSPIIINIVHTASETQSRNKMSIAAKSVLWIRQVKWIFPKMFHHSHSKCEFSLVQFVNNDFMSCCVALSWKHLCVLKSPDMLLFAVSLC